MSIKKEIEVMKMYWRGEGNEKYGGRLETESDERERKRILTKKGGQEKVNTLISKEITAQKVQNISQGRKLGERQRHV